MIVIIVIVVIIAIISVFTVCVMRNTGEDENSQILEDEEQMEYLRKWREEHDKHL